MALIFYDSMYGMQQLKAGETILATRNVVFCSSSPSLPGHSKKRIYGRKRE